MRTVTFPSGRTAPVLGQGTWKMGEVRRQHAAEVAALRLGLDLGMTLIDTAEMYGEGEAEKVVAEAIAGRRTEVFLVSKFYPQNATRYGVAAACEGSLSRLKTDFLDLYLYHWPGPIPLEETVEALEQLRRQGKIRDWGVSNFDTDEMENLLAAGGIAVATNQVLYNLARRGVEWDLLPWCRSQGIPIMAYSPVEQGRLLSHPALGSRPSETALAWLLQKPDVMVIPKASSPEHVRENRAALDVKLTPADLKRLDDAFPPPKGKRPLEML